MYNPVRTVAPVIKPVTRTEVKAALDIGYTDKDTLIDGLIAAATSHFESILERSLCEQTWSQSFDEVCGTLPLSMGPVISITSVKYLDADGVEQTIDPVNYGLISTGMKSSVRFISGYTAPTLYATSPAVSVVFKAGYANGGSDPNFTSTVPDNIRQAMFLLIRQWFDNPSAAAVGVTVEKMPNAVDALLSPYRPMNV
jgi:uncharacterized phiE125 gp8 family phage protein